MNRKKILSAVIATTLCLASQAEEESWIADGNGCRVLNPHPTAEESITWSGACLEGYAEGAGVLQWFRAGRPRTRVEGVFERGRVKGKARQIYASGLRFEGEHVDGKPAGLGVMVWPNGDSYEGDFKNGEPAYPETIVRKRYFLKEEVTGSSIRRDSLTGSAVPLDKPYAELTPEEKRIVKVWYLGMPEEDEPPYPSHGLLPELSAAKRAQENLNIGGSVYLVVTIDSTGVPTGVDVVKSPDPELTKAIADILMVERFKPAICHGVPCKMEYPFRAEFGTSNRGVPRGIPEPRPSPRPPR
jgi:hypothetical protein